MALMLAGHPLPPPNVVKVDWKVNQRFSVADDPDRTDPKSFTWQDPGFLLSKNPIEFRGRTTVEELDLKGNYIDGYHDGYSFARVIHNVLDDEDCAQLMKQVNDKGFTPALLNIGRGYQQWAPDIRDGLRVIIDSPPLTKHLLEVIRPHLPDFIPINVQCGVELVELNERCRFLCYTPGQEFEAHCDGRYTRTNGDESRVTVQFYLHDVPPENGGATTFLGRGPGGQQIKLECNPRAGSALIFTQDLLHEGSRLEKGLKYTMRTEAMYRRIARKG
eukprot:CAMPEP_0181297634 /NCGR_PEP_ID=MMETSP1101-20121128/5346_1 /TAXON_ID=46948 /ORGANISM="Rhodomonas abbreviata, Strain Caron Lab Isolate" /LENGTH=274 /DNA_ID=CAMNT_0023402587 /DNA_START=62 /DNA_END=886 /DNA_ORIENTATION=+